MSGNDRDVGIAVGLGLVEVVLDAELVLVEVVPEAGLVPLLVEPVPDVEAAGEEGLVPARVAERAVIEASHPVIQKTPQANVPRAAADLHLRHERMVRTPLARESFPRTGPALPLHYGCQAATQ